LIKVCKFGGSSVANAKQFEKIKSIILEDDSRNIIITSALGTDETNQVKITDLLFLLYAHIEYGVDHQITLNSIKQRFRDVCKDLKLSFDIDNEIESLNKELNKNISKDYLVSRGEYFTAKILSEYLGYEFVDAKDVIHLNYDGSVDYKKTEESLMNVLNKFSKIVIPGYYAKTPNNMIRLFSRGGSDLTGSIVAKCVNASLYENWTDVSGIYVADPRIINNPKKIKNITYDELRELSYRGAKVLHQESVIPLENISIPIQIKNTNKPNDFGTIIADDISLHEAIVTGIAGNKNYSSFNIKKSSNRRIAKVLRDVLDLFIRYKLNPEHIPTGIDTFSVITNSDRVKEVYFDLISEIRNIDGIIDLSIEDDIALIAIVGRKMSHIPGVAGRIFTKLGNNNVNIKVIAQASTEISIIIGVSNSDYEDAIRFIYEEFY
jgi:aspartate kinase